MEMTEVMKFIDENMRAVSGYMAIKYAKECLTDALVEVKDVDKEHNKVSVAIIPYEQYVRVCLREFVALLIQGYDPWEIMEKEGIQKGGDIK